MHDKNTGTFIYPSINLAVSLHTDIINLILFLSEIHPTICKKKLVSSSIKISTYV